MTRIARPAGALSRLIHLLWQQPLWAVGFALFFGTISGTTRGSYLKAYEFSVVFAYAIGVALWITGFFVIPRLPVPPGADSPGAIAVGTAYALMCLVASYGAALILQLTFAPGFLGNTRAVLVTGMYSMLFIALFSGIRFAMAYHQVALERARGIEQARADLAQAELRALRAQIHPHFLFNTLNSIASLIASNPAAAEDVTTRLADLFRYTLRASEREHAPLGEELGFLRDYLDIERVRFGDRLRVEEHVEPGIENLAVPALLLQPLVENAVRHGVSPRVEGGTVRLSARREGESLVLEVADDGPGLDGTAPPAGNGFGLHFVRERLRAAGLPDALAVETSPGRGTRARITLPLRTSTPT